MTQAAAGLISGTPASRRAFLQASLTVGGTLEQAHAAAGSAAEGACRLQDDREAAEAARYAGQGQRQGQV